MLPTRLAAAEKTSVSVNGLLLPFTQAVFSFARFCRPLAFHNDDPTYELSTVGSAMGIRVMGVNVLISSRHQLGKGAMARDPSDVVVIIQDGSQTLSLTGNEVVTVTVDEAGQRRTEDVFMLRFDDHRAGRDLRPYFCRLDHAQLKDPSEIPAGSKVLAFVAIGYPSAHQHYGYGWDEEAMAVVPGEIRSRWVRVYLDAAEPLGMDKPGLVGFDIDQAQIKAIGDLDGLSGSPVLMVYQEPNLQAHMAVAGMVLWASSLGRANVLPASRLRGAVDRLVHERRTA